MKRLFLETRKSASSQLHVQLWVKKVWILRYSGILWKTSRWNNLQKGTFSDNQCLRRQRLLDLSARWARIMSWRVWSRLAKCHGFGGLIRVNFLEVWGKFFESVIRVFDVWVILPHAPPQLSNFTPLYRVTKCHRNGRYICVKVLEVWGKILGE